MIPRPCKGREAPMKMIDTFLKPMHPEGWKFVAIFAAISVDMPC